jgi:hypothetical protein
MSGFQPVQMPDFGATLARSQQFGANQLLAIAQMRQLQEAQAKEEAYSRYSGDLANPDPAVRMNAFSQLARFAPQAFMDAIQKERDRNWDADAPAGAPAAAPAMPAAGAGRVAAMPGAPSGAPPLASPDLVLPAPGGAPSTVGGLPALPGWDMARVIRAREAAARGNPVAKQYYETYLAEARLQDRDLVPIRRLDGSTVMVPRSQAAGMVSAPEPDRELVRAAGEDGSEEWVPRSQAAGARAAPPRPAGGNDPTGQAGDTLLRLSDKVRAGTATPAEVERWTQAYDAYTAERRDPQGNTVPGRPETPAMRAAREALTQRQAPPAAPPPQTGAPIGTTGMTAEPPGGQGARPRTETMPSGSTRTVTPPRITPQAQEAARKLEVDAAGLSAATQQFREAMRLYGAGRTGLQAFNPRSEEGARLQQAFENLKMALRGEAFANTGVLQPGENRMLDEILRNPRSLTGLLSSVEASNAQLDELLAYAEAKVNGARRAADLPPLSLRPQGGGAGNPQRPPLSSYQR